MPLLRDIFSLALVASAFASSGTSLDETSRYYSRVSSTTSMRPEPAFSQPPIPYQPGLAAREKENSDDEVRDSSSQDGADTTGQEVLSSRSELIETELADIRAQLQEEKSTTQEQLQQTQTGVQLLFKELEDLKTENRARTEALELVELSLDSAAVAMVARYLRENGVNVVDESKERVVTAMLELSPQMVEKLFTPSVLDRMRTEAVVSSLDKDLTFKKFGLNHLTRGPIAETVPTSQPIPRQTELGGDAAAQMEKRFKEGSSAHPHKGNVKLLSKKRLSLKVRKVPRKPSPADAAEKIKEGDNKLASELQDLIGVNDTTRELYSMLGIEDPVDTPPKPDSELPDQSIDRTTSSDMDSPTTALPKESSKRDENTATNSGNWGSLGEFEPAIKTANAAAQVLGTTWARNFKSAAEKDLDNIVAPPTAFPLFVAKGSSTQQSKKKKGDTWIFDRTAENDRCNALLFPNSNSDGSSTGQVSCFEARRRDRQQCGQEPRLSCFLTDCLQNGDYAPGQCNPETGCCWCVFDDGLKVMGSAEFGFKKEPCVVRSNRSPKDEVVVEDESETAPDSVLEDQTTSNETRAMKQMLGTLKVMEEDLKIVSNQTNKNSISFITHRHRHRQDHSLQGGAQKGKKRSALRLHKRSDRGDHLSATNQGDMKKNLAEAFRTLGKMSNLTTINVNVNIFNNTRDVFNGVQGSSVSTGSDKKQESNNPTHHHATKAQQQEEDIIARKRKQALEDYCSSSTAIECVRRCEQCAAGAPNDADGNDCNTCAVCSDYVVCIPFEKTPSEGSLPPQDKAQSEPASQSTDTANDDQPSAVVQPAESPASPPFEPEDQVPTTAIDMDDADAKQICSNSGFGLYSKKSLCTSMYMSDIYLLLFHYANAGIDATTFCNNGGPFGLPPNTEQLSVQEIMARMNNRELCPSCYQTKSCTKEDLLVFADAQCTEFCSSHGYSLWPQTTATSDNATPVVQDSATENPTPDDVTPVVQDSATGNPTPDSTPTASPTFQGELPIFLRKQTPDPVVIEAERKNPDESDPSSIAGAALDESSTTQNPDGSPATVTDRIPGESTTAQSPDASNGQNPDETDPASFTPDQSGTTSDPEGSGLGSATDRINDETTPDVSDSGSIPAGDPEESNTSTGEVPPKVKTPAQDASFPSPPPPTQSDSVENADIDCQSDDAKECVRRCTQCIGAEDGAPDADGNDCSSCQVCTPYIQCVYAGHGVHSGAAVNVNINIFNNTRDIFNGVKGSAVSVAQGDRSSAELRDSWRRQKDGWIRAQQAWQRQIDDAKRVSEIAAQRQESVEPKQQQQEIVEPQGISLEEKVWGALRDRQGHFDLQNHTVPTLLYSIVPYLLELSEPSLNVLAASLVARNVGVLSSRPATLAAAIAGLRPDQISRMFSYGGITKLMKQLNRLEAAGDSYLRQLLADESAINAQEQIEMQGQFLSRESTEHLAHKRAKLFASTFPGFETPQAQSAPKQMAYKKPSTTVTPLSPEVVKQVAAAMNMVPTSQNIARLTDELYAGLEGKPDRIRPIIRQGVAVSPITSRDVEQVARQLDPSLRILKNLTAVAELTDSLYAGLDQLKLESKGTTTGSNTAVRNTVAELQANKKPVVRARYKGGKIRTLFAPYISKLTNAVIPTVESDMADVDTSTATRLSRNSPHYPHKTEYGVFETDGDPVSVILGMDS